MKIAIDLGHGVGQDRGAESIFITEEKIINEVGALVINKLKALGHTIIEVRPASAKSVGNSLTQRVQKANSNNVDLYVSIHANAGGGRGSEVYIYRGKEVKEARNVLNNLVSLGFANRGIKSSNLFVINNTKATAMLIEVCFVDTQSDVNLYRNIGAEKIADAIVKGLTGSTVKVNTPQQSKHQENHISTNLRDWQGAYNDSFGKNILVDGDRGEQVEKAMKNAILKRGSFNPLVAWLQCRLGIKIDCDFGKNTYNAVIKFQKENGLEQDGIVGYNTWNCLFKKFYW